MNSFLDVELERLKCGVKTLVVANEEKVRF